MATRRCSLTRAHIIFHWRNFYDRPRLRCRRAPWLDFIIKMPRVTTLLEWRKDVLGDRIALFLSETFLQPANDLARAY